MRRVVAGVLGDAKDAGRGGALPRQVAVIRAQVAIAECDGAFPQRAGLVEHAQLAQVGVDGNPAGRQVLVLVGRGVTVPRDSRQRHQPVAVRDAQDDRVDLGAIEAETEVVAKTFDAINLEAHLLALSSQLSALRISYRLHYQLKAES